MSFIIKRYTNLCLFTATTTSKRRHRYDLDHWQEVQEREVIRRLEEKKTLIICTTNTNHELQL